MTSSPLYHTSPGRHTSMNDQDNTVASHKNQAGSLSKKERGILISTHKKHIIWQVQMSRSSLIERAVLVAMLKIYWSHNQALDYLTGVKDGIPIYPGVQQLAHIVGAKERSVRSALKTWRDAGVLVPTSHAKGGRNATRYLLRQDRIWRLDNRDKPQKTPFAHHDKPCTNPAQTLHKPCTTPAQTLHKPCINSAKFADGIYKVITQEDYKFQGLISSFDYCESQLEASQ